MNANEAWLLFHKMHASCRCTLWHIFRIKHAGIQDIPRAMENLSKRGPAGLHERHETFTNGGKKYKIPFVCKEKVSFTQGVFQGLNLSLPCRP
ncbi:MAG: hypothetical protein IJ083_09565 [Clostridia bacterium]|nr:hypothetical protein [Clostridia bacterium]